MKAIETARKFLRQVEHDFLVPSHREIAGGQAGLFHITIRAEKLLPVCLAGTANFGIRHTDLWKSGNVTTGRGFLESIGRRVAELADDATQRERIAETKRRQIVELTGLQDRTFTHADELESQRRRLEEVNSELEKCTNSPGGEQPDEEAEVLAHATGGTDE